MCRKKSEFHWDSYASGCVGRVGYQRIGFAKKTEASDPGIFFGGHVKVKAVALSLFFVDTLVHRFSLPLISRSQKKYQNASRN